MKSLLYLGLFSLLVPAISFANSYELDCVGELTYAKSGSGTFLPYATADLEMELTRNEEGDYAGEVKARFMSEEGQTLPYGAEINATFVPKANGEDLDLIGIEIFLEKYEDLASSEFNYISYLGKVGQVSFDPDLGISIFELSYINPKFIPYAREDVNNWPKIIQNALEDGGLEEGEGLIFSFSCLLFDRD